MNSGLPNSHPRCVAGAAVLLVRRDEDDCRYADKHVDEILNHCPLAEKEIYNIPVVVHIHPLAESDEAPVETADNDENERYAV